MSFSVLVFLFVLMFSFGFITQRVKRFNIWRFVIIGFLLPYASALSGVGEALSDLINSIRYRDAYEDIKRKEEEVEELRRQYEQAKANDQANRESQEARKKRQEESERFRQKQKAQSEKKQSSRSSGRSQSSSGSERSSRGSGSSSHSRQQSYTRSETSRERYLKILGLDPNGNHTSEDIKKAFRRKAMQYHPDRHVGKSAEFLREMGEKFKQVNMAYEQLVKEL